MTYNVRDDPVPPRYRSHRDHISRQGVKMEDNDNPFCQHNFAFASPNPQEKISFATKTPPVNGLDDFQVLPSNVEGRMYAQAWCELTKQRRIINYKKENEKRARNDDIGQHNDPTHSAWAVGGLIQFDSACAQNALAPDGTGDKAENGKVSYRFKREQRWECERAKLGSNFMTIFPDFVKDVWQHQIELGIFLEDTLQCAGRITYSQRQFQNDDDQGCSANLKLKKDFAKRPFCIKGGSSITRDSPQKEWMVQVSLSILILISTS